MKHRAGAMVELFAAFCGTIRWTGRICSGPDPTPTSRDQRLDPASRSRSGSLWSFGQQLAENAGLVCGHVHEPHYLDAIGAIPVELKLSVGRAAAVGKRPASSLAARASVRGPRTSSALEPEILLFDEADPRDSIRSP